MIRRIFLDVDGVLANWNKGAHQIHGLPYDDGVEGYQKWPYKRGPEGWDWNKDPKVNLSIAEMFAPMGFDFWDQLEWLHGGKELVSYLLTEHGDKLYLLTAPALTKGAVDGRLSWIAREIPELRKRTIICSCKEACANDDALLIDDCTKNVESFVQAGGRAIMVPRPYNTNEDLAHCMRNTNYMPHVIANFFTLQEDGYGKCTCNW